MWTLLTLLTLVGVMAYFMFFWSPDEAKAATTGPSPGTKGQTSSSFRPPSRALRFDSEKKWYGLTFQGFRDEYSFSTMRTAGEALEVVRNFFTSKRTKVILDDGHRIVYWRGWSILKFLRGHDTGHPQQIEISVQTGNGLTKISLLYRVGGFQLRTPPNQLRREVVKLHTRIAGTE